MVLLRGSYGSRRTPFNYFKPATPNELYIARMHCIGLPMGTILMRCPLPHYIGSAWYVHLIPVGLIDTENSLHKVCILSINQLLVCTTVKRKANKM